ncbi:hypothetical protein OGAPHI_001435 [Ogataea philodendri]|uniref:Uncharacterized protein n=1 Tax=Ogataea philodendri TaxID=1378263 RepID=A0A9P8PDK2_9ASCO|nr:uncharacterized protein OGAPHI_001435 [Ogataea philodendri]KAH3669314.1 hypothetical protein OGAPHI_001435 [Ogataea philodendri]
MAVNNNIHVRHGSEQGRRLHRLMGWSVFSLVDGVVSSDVDGLELLQASHSDGWSSVKVEHKERGRDWQEGALVVGSQSVGNGAHGMLSDTVLNVSTREVSSKTTLGGQSRVHEVFHTRPLQIHRHRQVRTTSNHRRTVLTERSHQLSGSCSGWSVSSELLLWKERLPVLWKFSSGSGQELGTFLRILLDVLGNQVFPFGNKLVSLCWLLFEEVVNVTWHVEFLSRVHSVLDLELSDSVLTQSTSVGSAVVFKSSAGSDDSSAVDQGWSVFLGLCVLQSLDDEDSVGDDVEARLVVGGSEVLGCNGQTNRVGDTLTQRTRGDFDGIVLDLRVTRTQRVEVVGVVRLQLVHGHRLETVKMLEDVLEQTNMTVGQDKSVSVEIVWVVGSIFHGVLPQSYTNSHGPHGGTGMATSILLDNVQNKGTAVLDNTLMFFVVDRRCFWNSHTHLMVIDSQAELFILKI